MPLYLDFSWLLNIFPSIPAQTWELIAAIISFVVFLMFIPGLIAYMIFKIIGLSGFKRLFSYEKRESIMHRLHPLPKILFVVFVSLGVAMSDRFVTLALLFLISIIMWSFSNPSEAKVRLITILLLTQWILVAWGQSFLNPGFTQPVYTRIYVFPRPIRWMFTAATLEGFSYGLFQGIRIVAAMSTAVLLITTTHPSEIIYGLRSFKLPMEINFMIAVTFRSIPVILEKSSLVLAAERARGLKLFPSPSKNPIKFLGDFLRIFKVVLLAFIPIIIESVRAGRQLALAASVKAFRAYKKRTYYRKIPFTRLDLILLLVFIAGIIFVVTAPFLAVYLKLPIRL